MKRTPFEKAIRAGPTHEHDYIGPYVEGLAQVLDMDAIRTSGIRIAVDPMGGASLPFWDPVASRYGIQLDVVNRDVDPTFGFMTVDKDGKIRMDCSSPYAMARLIGLKDRYVIAFGNDPDSYRHGIVTRSAGLMNPNHYLAVAIWYLFQNRPGWRPDAVVGKTRVSSSLIDRVAAHLGRKLSEVPVGFKWFVGALLKGTCGFGGEESAGDSFLEVMAPYGLQKKTDSSSACLLQKSLLEPERIRASTTRTLLKNSGLLITYASTDQPHQNRRGD